MTYRVLDLFSAAAGGWSLGMHRAGFTTVAACEVEAWRRALYGENNPGVRLYDDVRTLTGERLAADGVVPDIVVGSPPCQDISSANAKGKGVDGERSGLFFEAIRVVGECRPRWVALENSAHLRTKGSDRVLGALEDLGYTCWPAVVRARDIGANHERPRVWLLAFDADQIVQGAECGLFGWQSANSPSGVAIYADGHGRAAGWSGGWRGFDVPVPHDPEHTESIGHEGGRTRGHWPHGVSAPSTADRDATEDGRGSGWPRGCPGAVEGVSVEACRDAYGPHPNDQGQSDGAEHDEVGGSAGAGEYAGDAWAQWNGGLAHHLRLDDGLSAWVAQSRIAIGGSRGTAASSLLVEAFGDAVVPQIPEAIGRAILRTEAAVAAIFTRAAA